MLCVRGEAYHGTKRFLLLFSAFFSMLLPSLFFGVTIDKPAAYLSVYIDYYVKDGRLSDDLFYGQPNPETTFWEDVENMTLADWITFLYFAVVCIMLLRLLMMYISVLSMMCRLKRQSLKRYRLRGARLYVHNNEELAPFSWFGWIFLSRSDVVDGGREIISHEIMHTVCLHSLDVLLADILIVFQWFNPLAWKFKALLQELHEYDADARVLASGVDASRYKRVIIREAVGKEMYTAVCGFNSYIIKKRIIMMQMKNKSVWQYAKALYILPLAFLTACSFSSNEKSANEASDSIYVEVDAYPQFIGGLEAYQNYLINNVKYPEAAIQNRQEGRVLVGFVVETDGAISNVEIAETSGYEALDAEAKRAIASMSKWTPGVYKGVKVRTRFTAPVTFRIPAPAADAVDVQPEFPGGMKAMVSFLSKNIKYPEECVKAKVEGRTLVEFIVAADGKVCNAVVLQSSNNAALDAEALRVVSSMPVWKAGKKDGKEVDVRFTLPVTFKL